MLNLATKTRMRYFTGHDRQEQKRDDTAFSFPFKIFCGFLGNAVGLIDIETTINAKEMCLHRRQPGGFSLQAFVQCFMQCRVALETPSNLTLKRSDREEGQVEGSHLTQGRTDFQRVQAIGAGARMGIFRFLSQSSFPITWHHQSTVRTQKVGFPKAPVANPEQRCLFLESGLKTEFLNLHSLGRFILFLWNR